MSASVAYPPGPSAPTSGDIGRAEDNATGAPPPVLVRDKGASMAVQTVSVAADKVIRAIIEAGYFASLGG